MKLRIQRFANSVLLALALCCSLPCHAYAMNLEDYGGYIWTSSDLLDIGEYVGGQFIDTGITMLNTNWYNLGISPAYQAAIAAIQADYLRGTWWTVNDMRDELYVIENEIHNSNMGSWLSAIRNQLSTILNDVQGIRNNQVTMATGIQGVIDSVDSVWDMVYLVNENASGIYSRIGTLASNQVGISNQLRSYFHNDPNGDGTPGIIFGELDDILTVLESLYDGVATIGTYVDYTYQNLEYIIQNGIDISNWPQVFNDLTGVNTWLQKIYNTLQNGVYTDGGYDSFRGFIRNIFADVGQVNGRMSLYGLINGISVSLADISEDIGDIISLLAAGNVQDAVGDFDEVDFDANVDTLIDRISTLAPFGALLLVSAELDMLQTRAVDSPEMDLPFDFAGVHQVVHIDLTFLDDVQPFINWLVIMLLVYNLLWYTVDFIKLEAAS